MIKWFNIIKISRIRYAVPVRALRMKENEHVKRLFNIEPGGKRKRGRSRLRWTDEMVEDMRTMGVGIEECILNI